MNQYYGDNEYMLLRYEYLAIGRIDIFLCVADEGCIVRRKH
jgi:hypothetical protein